MPSRVFAPGSYLTIDSLIRHQSQTIPHEPIVAYPNSDYVDYTSRQLDFYAFRAASEYKKYIPQRKSSSDPQIVVGLLGISDLDYLITLLALSKLGHTVLFLSTRLQRAAYMSLLNATKSTYLVADSSFLDKAQNIREGEDGLKTLKIVKTIQRDVYQDLQNKESVNTRFDQNFDLKQEATKTCWIIHSSGSTGLPKPIYQTHAAALRNYSQSFGLRSFITLPLFHAHGLSSVFRAIYSGKQIHMYNASKPLTKDLLVNTMGRFDFEIFYAVPYVLKLLADDEEGIDLLSRMKIVMFGGSSCPKSIGDELVSKGVNLVSHYGTTETGQLMTSFRAETDLDWDYVRPSKDLLPYLRMVKRGDDIYELCVLDGWPSKVATNQPDGSYATKDLFTPHPTTPDAWRYYGRMDDTLVLVNGEKANPVPIEHAIRRNPLVAEALVFGASKERLGMLVFPSTATTGMEPKTIIDQVMVSVNIVNSEVPGFSKLTKEMIRVMPLGTSYPCTDKGTIIRAACYKKFSKEIEDIYSSADGTSDSDGLVLSEPELREFLRDALKDMLSLGNGLEDDADFFSFGLDSLQAIQLRTLISKKLYLNGVKVGMNIVFDYPSIGLLARKLYDLRTGEDAVSDSPEVQMQRLIDQYSSFEQHTPIPNNQDGEYLVVTGVTGSLGAHIASKLARLTSVKSIYCLVRAESDAQARNRVVNSLKSRGVYHCLSLAERRKLISLSSDFSNEDLGLGSARYDEISAVITGCIHSAWAVNFNLSLSSFVKDNISGACNLMKLCLRAKRESPATFNFCSSVSTVARTPSRFAAEALPEDLSVAQGMGYAQSKLVTENICSNAAKTTTIRARVMRVGQIIGDTVNGIWNPTEAIPLMLQASQTINAIPALNETLLWLPVDTVASSVLEISLSKAQSAFVNLVNHQSIHWTKDLLPALHHAGLSFDELEQRAWIQKLRESNQGPAANPPCKLLEFLTGKYDREASTMKPPMSYETSRARSLSPALSAASAPGVSLLQKFVSYWKSGPWKDSTQEPATKALIVVGGPCGSGKSTVARSLSAALSLPWLEGDNYHDTTSLAKMSSGIPLTDDDRWAWLETIRDDAVKLLEDNNHKAVIVTCSALKRSYRDVLRKTPAEKPIRVLFLALQADRDLLSQRLTNRQSHFMKVGMVDGQLLITEDPEFDESDITPIDVGRDKDDVKVDVIELVKWELNRRT